MIRNVLIGLTLTLSLSAAAFAGPISSCTLTSTGFTCNLYETDPLGNPSEIGWAVPLPTTVVPGVVAFTDPTGISDILTFTTTTVQLTSGENLVCLGCFSIAENLTGPTTWAPTPNVYVSFSDPEVNPVPEPGSLALLGSGMLALAGAAKRKLFRA